ncbi:MAG: hypothetical protein PHS45_01110 [Bacilli bacterium]|nr:hypothetical protein [Bacilli bacterium]
MKIIRFIKKIIIGILVAAFFAFAISMTILLLSRNDYGITQIDDTSLVFIKKEVSSDKYKKGDLVLIESKKLNEVNIGDELFIYQLDSTGKVSIDVGVVGEIHPEYDAISFENGSTYEMQFVIGKTDKVYNKIGAYLSVILSRWGFLFMILVPSFLIFVYQLYALIVEIKYGNEEVEA